MFGLQQRSLRIGSRPDRPPGGSTVVSVAATTSDCGACWTCGCGSYLHLAPDLRSILTLFAPSRVGGCWIWLTAAASACLFLCDQAQWSEWKWHPIMFDAPCRATGPPYRRRCWTRLRGESARSSSAPPWRRRSFVISRTIRSGSCTSSCWSPADPTDSSTSRTDPTGPTGPTGPGLRTCIRRTAGWLRDDIKVVWNVCVSFFASCSPSGALMWH